MNKIADFRSDTVTRPSVAMKETIFSAPLGDDGFSDDPSVIELEKLATELTGKEVPSLTLAQEKIDTNILFYTVPDSVNANELALELENEGMLFCPFSDSLLRIVTHLDVTMEDGKRLVSLLKDSKL